MNKNSENVVFPITRALFVKTPDGIDSIGELKIDRIISFGDDFACCWEFKFDTVSGSGRTIGADPLQAFSLALGRLDIEIESYISRGYSISLFEEGGCPFLIKREERTGQEEENG